MVAEGWLVLPLDLIRICSSIQHDLERLLNHAAKDLMRCVCSRWQILF